MVLRSKIKRNCKNIGLAHSPGHGGLAKGRCRCAMTNNYRGSLLLREPTTEELTVEVCNKYVRQYGCLTRREAREALCVEIV